MGRPTSLRYLVKTTFRGTILGLLASFILYYFHLQNGTLQDIAPSSEECVVFNQNNYGSRISSLQEFYPFYLCEHFKPKTKLFHFLGLFNAVLLIFIFVVYNRHPKTILFAFMQGYLFAWVSHAFIEVNKPATFTYPAYSFVSDWIMFKDLWLGSLAMW
ncbi:hypothetical protein TCAL_00556 [Tigriopus californicus]|uniref:DUF962 domain-containing protein n=1 Tax=Tigriopus californicus TaxID=6832 RepID=A0A553PAN9_TIGCA|nr:uncharacterized protein LOC131893602 [Tigriopus californicus]XP_059099676.1 uncharacterized protein LOC131893602 [Tigriopus californicus]TRY74747.1 hypothetical protein TCAL_00556 [Tigriopus californicus]|eukprot:TCALIF_00556-PA protein Name:"Protein of unknown function" AED:0.08 eAED:0.08 QI:27/1/1/1/1/1/2/402/158